MKRVRSLERVRLRRELAQLLKRLRGIRRTKLSGHELSALVSTALAEAGSISQLVTFGSVNPGQYRRSQDRLARVDKRRLEEAEEALADKHAPEAAHPPAMG